MGTVTRPAPCWSSSPRAHSGDTAISLKRTRHNDALLHCPPPPPPPPLVHLLLLPAAGLPAAAAALAVPVCTALAPLVSEHTDKAFKLSKFPCDLLMDMLSGLSLAPLVSSLLLLLLLPLDAGASWNREPEVWACCSERLAARPAAGSFRDGGARHVMRWSWIGNHQDLDL